MRVEAFQLFVLSDYDDDDVVGGGGRPVSCDEASACRVTFNELRTSASVAAQVQLRALGAAEGEAGSGKHEAATGMVSKDQDLDGQTGTPSEPLPSLLNLLLCSDPGIDMDIVWTLHSDSQRPSSRPVPQPTHPHLCIRAYH